MNSADKGTGDTEDTDTRAERLSKAPTTQTAPLGAEGASGAAQGAPRPTEAQAEEYAGPYPRDDGETPRP